MKLFIGLMSGTSMDGIDAALVDVDTNRLLAGITYPYSKKTRTLLEDVLAAEKIMIAVLAQLNTLIGRDFAAAAQELLSAARVTSADVIAIGSHGQTILHEPFSDIPCTVQLGCAHTIAELTKITVAADFRSRDLVVGGQGAPFAPLYHHELFGHLKHAAVVNIGGIANVSFLNDEGGSGFDTGPGNCLMDAWIKKHLGKDYDEEGRWAARGQIIFPLLEKLLQDAFFKLPAPKSIGKEYFSLAWLEKYGVHEFAPEDVQATLLALTAASVAAAIEKRQSEQIIICGGGAHNLVLLHALQGRLHNKEVVCAEQFEVSSDFLEAMMFAWLAEKTLTQTPLDLSKITGSAKPVVLGALYHRGT
ncbi:MULTISPECIES: anhydro-N-acetylmuramic acid kinase [Legionella]|uniref:Anhydro-N-acetylmuramic acid kinase n=1 Tax=Legionella septentrionalis TaxID=2498109 RepID=A0A3S0WQW6_9GAMM|nr:MULTISPECIES: anhydro-N-acetylmuramic acid kinase [Legionella]MCP0914410.1 anhydro-N-acetylmuramic acid kinase [Legionella sp. 27cVA30]RUQ81874.1 anhydro-N-acetylmuramic acid kinase [Legionella septentrionalis]RUR00244.1 anhydro-N-acetylmuramic acid kinase [Legionella septentrionalis]RUR09420.1 anhydro-N-acetylmuramic acid kinase [Legionella septentrionalis]